MCIRYRPSTALPLGSLHPLSVVKNDIEELFLGMGYQVAEGPEVESDHYNFCLLYTSPSSIVCLS